MPARCCSCTTPSTCKVTGAQHRQPTSELSTKVPLYNMQHKSNATFDLCNDSRLNQPTRSILVAFALFNSILARNILHRCRQLNPLRAESDDFGTTTTMLNTGETNEVATRNVIMTIETPKGIGMDLVRSDDTGGQDPL